MFTVQGDSMDATSETVQGIKTMNRQEKERYEMKYKVGDRVRVRRDLKNDVSYGSRYTVEKMMDYKGNVVTISEVRQNYYKIEEDEEGWDWTDEMFEGLVDDELTVEEAIRLRAKMCANTYCNECRSGKRNNGERIDCCDFSQKYPERVVEILKQWKKEHEKKEVETEHAIMVRVLVGNDCNGKCVHEEEVPSGEIWERAQERVLKEYCENHEGKYISTICGICRIKE